MRSIWKGTITLALLSLPVKLYSATEDNDIPHHQVHQHDGGKIRYHKVCESCSETIPAGDIATQYETEDGTVILSQDDLAALPSENSREIQILEFIDNTIDPMMLDRPYFIGIDGNPAAKAYALLTTVLQNRTAIAQFSMRGRNRLAALTVRDGVIVAHTLKWPEEIRPAFINGAENMIVAKKREELTEAEIGLATQLVESMTKPFDPSRYKDTAKEELRELIASKVSGEGLAEVSDLVAKLQAAQPKKRRTRKAS